MTDKADIVIGAYYERPDGSVARTCGWDGQARLVSYVLDDGAGPAKAQEAEVAAGWRRRPDLDDFPNARDPVLPHVFDLFWDAKTRSSLPALLADPETAEEVRETMEGYGIVLTDAERERVEEMTAEMAAPSF